MRGENIADRLVNLAVQIIELVGALPDTPTGRHLAGQLLRCGTSPGANYEEARGAESRRDFVHKLGIALKELQETRYWLKVMDRTSIVGPHKAQETWREVDELCRIVGSSQRTARASIRKNTTTI